MEELLCVANEGLPLIRVYIYIYILEGTFLES